MNLFTYGPSEPPEKCKTFNDILPGLFMMLSINFQDFPGPGIVQKNPRLSRRRGNFVNKS